MRIAVAGGTGVVGSYVVEAAQAAGHTTVVLSRSHGVDLVQGDGLAEALRGVEVIIDTTNSPSTRKKKSTQFFTIVAARLSRVGCDEGVRHLIALSIVGIERVPTYGYYEAKLNQERAVVAGPLPSTIIRATQFHEFPAQVLGRSRMGPVAFMPDMPVQSIAARSVAERLVEAAGVPPSPDIAEMAGPERCELVSLARQVIRYREWRLRVVPIRVPGQTGQSVRRGGLLPTENSTIVGPTFAEWLLGPDGHKQTL